MQERLTNADANTLLLQLVGLPVSLPWKGYGSAIFLELGKLAPLRHARQNHNDGEATISIEWDWRVESGAKILYGSSNNRPRIARGIESLQGVKIEELSIQGKVPELAIAFSNGQRLVSAAMLTGDPEWSIRLQDARWMTCADGGISVGEGEGIGLTEEEEAAFEHAAQTAKRWGVPITEAAVGHCGKCQWFAAIDAPAELLEHGVCTSIQSSFDGRAVNVSSGCDAFLDQDAKPVPMHLKVIK